MSDSGNSTERPWLAGPPPPPPPVPGAGAGADPGTTRPSPSQAPRPGSASTRTAPSGGRPAPAAARPGAGQEATGASGDSRRSSLPGAAVGAKAAARDLKAQSPWMLAAGAVLLAFCGAWFAGILNAFQHTRGLTGQTRVLTFFTPGSFTWAVATLLAVSLVAAAHRFELAASGPGWLNELVPVGLFFAACAVTASAAVNVLIELTNFGHGIDRAMVGLIQYAVIIPVGLATAMWARKEWRNSSHH